MAEPVENNPPFHHWIKPFRIRYIPAWTSAALSEFVVNILESCKSLGNEVIGNTPDSFDVTLTTARFGEPVSWRSSPIFYLRKNYHSDRAPLVMTVVHDSQQEFNSMLIRLNDAISSFPPNSELFDFSGLAEGVYRFLHEQGQRAGPILALERLLQAQSAAIYLAFSQSEALRMPEDVRKIVFTILHGHGTVIVEKWKTGKSAFQLIWEYIDSGYITLSSMVPQDPF